MSRDWVYRSAYLIIVPRLCSSWSRMRFTAALELESPPTLAAVEFDDEADEVLVKSRSNAALNVVQAYVSILMTDPEFMESCIDRARQGGYLE